MIITSKGFIPKFQPQEDKALNVSRRYPANSPLRRLEVAKILRVWVEGKTAVFSQVESQDMPHNGYGMDQDELAQFIEELRDLHDNYMVDSARERKQEALEELMAWVKTIADNEIDWDDGIPVTVSSEDYEVLCEVVAKLVLAMMHLKISFRE